MNAPDPGYRYQIIRDEIRSEHALIGTRLNWYVTSQSFLVTAFAICESNGFVWFHWFATIVVPSVGLVASVLIFPSILAASATITLWHEKQKDFFESHKEFEAAFGMERPSWVERRGLLFPQIMPVLFGLLWLVIFVGSCFL
jgi:hypothetical protein